ncbi:MAG TPA: SCP2 sterol-binding domain-containing protein [bacterium]|nr:SCP2 sterol-binding domain-containing protein [bacterium]
MSEGSKYFDSRESFIETMDLLLGALKSDPVVGADVAKMKIVIRFEYTDPETSVTINGRDMPATEGDYLSYEWDTEEPEPDVVMQNTADFALRFWQGKENAMLAMASGSLKAKGNIAKAVSLIPAIKPAFKMFPKLLRENGKKHLALR